jgi:hypothetical protein
VQEPKNPTFVDAKSSAKHNKIRRGGGCLP